jgi:hypothetical protein
LGSFSTELADALSPRAFRFAPKADLRWRSEDKPDAGCVEVDWGTVIQATKLELRIMRYELTDYDCGYRPAAEVMK